MPKTAAQTANAAQIDEHDTTDITSYDIPLHRPILTTQSILESFLVDNITLDETLTEEELTKALKAAGVEKKKLNGKWVADLLTDLNKQRHALRKEIRNDIAAFAANYDAQPRPQSQDDEAIPLDRQDELLKETWSIKTAISKLEKAEKALQADCDALSSKLAKQDEVIDEMLQ